MDGAEGEDNAGASHLEVYSSSSAGAFTLHASSAHLWEQGRECSLDNGQLSPRGAESECCWFQGRG